MYIFHYIICNILNIIFLESEILIISQYNNSIIVIVNIECGMFIKVIRTFWVSFREMNFEVLLPHFW